MYTSIKARPLEKQLADPQNAEEFARLLTFECTEYLKRQGEKFEFHVDVMAALSQPFTGAETPGADPKTAEQLKGRLHYLTRRFYTSIGRERIHGAYQIARDEWFKRMVSPFLNKECKDNGDIYLKNNLDLAVWKVINTLLTQVEQLTVKIEILSNATKVENIPVFKPITEPQPPTQGGIQPT